MTLLDYIIIAESILIVLSVPLAIYGTARLVRIIMASSVQDKLARVITAYFVAVTLTFLWVMVVFTFRSFNDDPPPEWTRAVTGVLVLMIAVGPWYISHVARSGK